MSHTEFCKLCFEPVLDVDDGEKVLTAYKQIGLEKICCNCIIKIACADYVTKQ